MIGTHSREQAEKQKTHDAMKCMRIGHTDRCDDDIPANRNKNENKTNTGVTAKTRK